MNAPGWRVHQHGTKGTILAWFVPGEYLDQPVPGWAIMLAQPGTPAPPGLDRVVLVGYSAGCTDVRGALLGPYPEPLAVATIDGTHDRMGKAPTPAHDAVWKRLAARARAGDALWLATCLAAHVYVESIPAGKRGRAMSTARVLEHATGLQLLEVPSRPPSGVKPGGKGYTGLPAECRVSRSVDDGALHVRAYASSHTDAAEHAAQLTRVLPELWRRLVGPFLADAAPVTERSIPSGQLPARPLGERVADVAREYLQRGIVEVPGPGSNPQISSLLYPCRRGGTAVAGILDATGERILGKVPPDSIAWCAAARSFLVFLAGNWTTDPDRAACPHGYRCAVWELCADARRLGTLRLADGTYTPRPGDAAIFMRNGQNPLNPGQEGHVSTVLEGGRSFRTAGGNEADAFRESGHQVSEPGLVAFISFAG